MFDLLSITWDVSPVIFSIGSFELRWYSILFVIGFFPVGYYIMQGFFKREGLPVETLDAMLFALLIGTLVGARLGEVLFYNPSYYFAHPEEILKTWKGGLASHGGAIGVLCAMWWWVHKYGRKYGFGYIWILDRLVIPICFAGAFIRTGNLFNSEIYGDVTNLPWGFIFLRDMGSETRLLPHHPTQIYEALGYIALGISLITLYYKRLPKLKTGTIFGIFLIGLFGVRFLVEFIKEPQQAFENDMIINMGQVLSIPFIVAGIIILVMSHKIGKLAMLPQEKPNAPQNQYKKQQGKNGKKK